MGEARHLTGTHGRLDAEHAALAARQEGVASLAQLVAIGFTASAIHKRASSGRLHRVHQAVYSLAPPELLSRDGRFMAAVLACGPGAVVSHRSAAALHELRATARSGIEVTVPRENIRVGEGVQIHRSRTLTAADVTTVKSIPCTTVARTLLDLAAVLPRRGVRAAPGRDPGKPGAKDADLCRSASPALRQMSCSHHGGVAQRVFCGRAHTRRRVAPDPLSPDALCGTQLVPPVPMPSRRTIGMIEAHNCCAVPRRRGVLHGHARRQLCSQRTRLLVPREPGHQAGASADRFHCSFVAVPALRVRLPLHVSPGRERQ